MLMIKTSQELYASFEHNGQIMESVQYAVPTRNGMVSADSFKIGEKVKLMWDAGSAGKKLRTFVCRKSK